jgi:hypothetical protein
MSKNLRDKGEMNQVFLFIHFLLTQVKYFEYSKQNSIIFGPIGLNDMYFWTVCYR